MPEITKTATVYAARYTKTDGSVAYQGESADRGEADLIVESVNVHLDTLDADERKTKGIDRCELVTRVVTDYADGSEHRSPWVVSA